MSKDALQLDPGGVVANWGLAFDLTAFVAQTSATITAPVAGSSPIPRGWALYVRPTSQPVFASVANRLNALAFLTVATEDAAGNAVTTFPVFGRFGVALFFIAARITVSVSTFTRAGHASSPTTQLQGRLYLAPDQPRVPRWETQSAEIAAAATSPFGVPALGTGRFSLMSDSPNLNLDWRDSVGVIRNGLTAYDASAAALAGRSPIFSVPPGASTVNIVNADAASRYATVAWEVQS